MKGPENGWYTRASVLNDHRIHCTDSGLHSLWLNLGEICQSGIVDAENMERLLLFHADCCSNGCIFSEKGDLGEEQYNMETAEEGFLFFELVEEKRGLH